jgi:L-histidine Nalpha-methyltransferase
MQSPRTTERIAIDVHLASDGILTGMAEDVREGLTSPFKELPPKYFYDERGSRLFEEITRLPEYYLTRAERRLLEANAAAIVTASGSPAALVELGPGNAEKTTILLEPMLGVHPAVVYVPVDVSAAYLDALAQGVARERRGIVVRGVRADFTGPYDLPEPLPEPALHALLGSTLGNFPGEEGVRLLRRIRRVMRRGDHLLLGLDLHKDTASLEAAYDDAAGVTADFNRNILRVLNRHLGSDFDPAAFEHRAFYDAGERRIEMHLVARRDLRVAVPGVGTVAFRAGESIHTENSCKYDRPGAERLLVEAGLRPVDWLELREPAYALVLAR